MVSTVATNRDRMVVAAAAAAVWADRLIGKDLRMGGANEPLGDKQGSLLRMMKMEQAESGIMLSLTVEKCLEEQVGL